MSRKIKCETKADKLKIAVRLLRDFAYSFEDLQLWAGRSRLRNKLLVEAATRLADSPKTDEFLRDVCMGMIRVSQRVRLGMSPQEAIMREWKRQERG